MIKRIHSGGPFEEKIGYCRTVVAGGFAHLAGTVCGTDPQTGEDTTDVVKQCEGILNVLSDALGKAGCGFKDVVRVNYYLPDAAEFEPCWPLLHAAFGDNPPAATMIECGLIAPHFRIEIELTALVPGH
ncbi:MAG: RidA family protein [Planktomarina sp.]